MDLRITDDQQLLLETTRKFLESTAPLETVRRLADEEPAGFDRDWWRSGAELGWTSLLVSEADGGGSVSGHGLLDLVLVAESMGSLVSPGPLVPTNVVAEALARSGSADQRRRLLPGLMSGASVAAWCLGAPAAGIDSGGRVGAKLGDTGVVLDGVSGPVEAGGQADVYLVTAATEDGVAQFIVPSDSPGVTVDPANSLDLVRRFAQIRFDQVAVGHDAALGVAETTVADIEHQLQTVAVLQCAEMVGAMDRVFEFTVEYAADRYSFGRPLASYQALKHRFADMKVWLEAAHATAGAAARAVDSDSTSAAELVSVAKAYIGDRGPVILQDCVQIHGGIGVTWDHDLHLYLRRVVVDRTQWGTPRDHRERVAVAMGMEGDVP
ncbi:MAG TPA: acyl-CoA dehydrogenase family protein [Acidimicrobiales bacterium]|nr:acyl-CoA dehydrogenase family protein [Acidimicrobiales bacterium]